MVGVIGGENRTAEQLRLIASLRWHLFVNSLRTWRGKADLAARVVVGAVMGAGVLGLGVLLALGSWAAFHDKTPLILIAELWVVFAIWQLLPIFITGFGAQADLGSLLRFPLRYSAFVTLTLAYGLTDPVSVSALFWLLMILAGIALGAPVAVVWAVPALTLFVAVNLLLSRAAFAWLDRWLAQRRTREILGLGFFLVIMSFQLCGPVTERWGKRAVPGLTRLDPVQRPFPPGLAGYMIESGQSGSTAPALLGLGGLVAFAALFGWLLLSRLRAQYRGESLSEAPRGQTSRESPIARQGWHLAGFSPSLAALFERDFRYFCRNSAQLINLAVPLILVLVFSLNSGTRGRHSLVGGAAFFPVSIGYCVLALSAFAYNCFGYDGPGVAMLFAAPLDFRDVFVSKNLLHGTLVSIEMILVSTLVFFVAGPPSALMVVQCLAGALFLAFLNFAAGNLVSLYFPRRLQFGTLRRQNASGTAVLLTILVPIGGLGVAAGAYSICRWIGRPQWAVEVLLALAAIAFVVYRRVLAACVSIAARQRDVLMAELAKQ